MNLIDQLTILKDELLGRPVPEMPCDFCGRPVPSHQVQFSTSGSSFHSCSECQGVLDSGQDLVDQQGFTWIHSPRGYKFTWTDQQGG